MSMHWVSRSILLGVGVALGVSALVFASLNRQAVEIDLYFGETLSIPLWVLVVICLVLGWLVPTLLGTGRWFRRHRERTRLKRRVEALEREVLELRNIPLDLDVKAARPNVKRTDTAPAPRAAGVVPQPKQPLLLPSGGEAESDFDDIDLEVSPD